MSGRGLTFCEEHFILALANATINERPATLDELVDHALSLQPTLADRRLMVVTFLKRSLEPLVRWKFMSLENDTYGRGKNWNYKDTSHAS
jgi:hypothetical protein